MGGGELLAESKLNAQPGTEKDLCCLDSSGELCLEQRWHKENRKSFFDILDYWFNNLPWTESGCEGCMSGEVLSG